MLTALTQKHSSHSLNRNMMLCFYFTPRELPTPLSAIILYVLSRGGRGLGQTGIVRAEAGMLEQFPFQENNSAFVLRPGNKTRKSRVIVLNINIYLTRLLPKHLAWTWRVPWLLGQDVHCLQLHPSSRQCEGRTSETECTSVLAGPVLPVSEAQLFPHGIRNVAWGKKHICTLPPLSFLLGTTDRKDTSSIYIYIYISAHLSTSPFHSVCFLSPSPALIPDHMRLW